MTSRPDDPSDQASRDRGTRRQGWMRLLLAVLAVSIAPRFLPASEMATGTRHVLFMPVKFADDLREPIRESAARELMAGVDRFFRANSRGAFSIETTITPTLTLPVTRAEQLGGSPVLGNGAAITLLRQAREAVTAAGFSDASYDFDCVYVDASFAEGAGLGLIGRRGAWLHLPDVGVACHEFGHNLGLWHANAWETADGAPAGPGLHVERGDPFDTMGCGTAGVWHFNAWSKHALGWLPESAVRTFTTNGLYRLYPSDQPDLPSDLTCALRISKDLSRDYWIETRRQSDGHPQCRQSLLLHWSPWGASQYGTHLLGVDSNHSVAGDAHLRPGHAFEDTDLGLKIIPLPAAENPDAVDVLVQTLHQVLIEAEDAEPDAAITARLDPETSRGGILTTVRPGSIRWATTLPASGHYTLRARVRWPADPFAALEFSVDGSPVGLCRPAPRSSPDRWEWETATRRTPPSSDPFPEIADYLRSGGHTIAVTFDAPGIDLDCVLLSTDPTANLHPLVTPVPNQETFTGVPVGPLLFTVVDVETPAAELHCEVSSPNPRLFPPTNLVLGGAGMNRTLRVTPAEGKFGEGTLVLKVTDGAGNEGRTDCHIRVVGPLQARVESAAPGATLTVPPGTYLDALVVDRDLALVAHPANPAVLDSDDHGIPLTVRSNATVYLRGFRIRRGAGGAIRNDGVLTLEECVVEDCRGALKGTLLNRGSLHLERCIIRRNRASFGAAVENHGVLDIDECTIRDNLASQAGGALHNAKEGVLVLRRTTLSGNETSGGSGGALWNAGEGTLSHCTMSGNRAGCDHPETGGGLGGAIANFGLLSLEACTIASNRADIAAGGIESQGLTRLRTSILAGNHLSDGRPSDGRGPVISEGHNLIQFPESLSLRGYPIGDLVGVDPELTPLGDHGGTTWTHALRHGSPVIDQGDAPTPSTDQRGFPRPDQDSAGDSSDIGACEYTPSFDGPAGAENDELPLEVSIRKPGPFPELTLNGVQPGSRHILLASPDLVDWWPMATNIATGMVLEFRPPADPGLHRQFYRTRRSP